MRYVAMMLLVISLLGACSPGSILSTLTGHQVGQIAQVVPDAIDETTELVTALKPTDGTVKTSVRPQVRGDNNHVQTETRIQKADDGAVVTKEIKGDFTQNNGLPYWVLLPIGLIILLFWEMDNPRTILNKMRKNRTKSRQ